MARVWLLRVDHLYDAMQELVDAELMEYRGRLSFIVLHSYIRELLGFVVGYHQPEDIERSEIYTELINMGLPSMVASGILEKITLAIDATIRITTKQRVHYSTHTVVVSMDGNNLVVAEQRYDENIRNDSPRHDSGFTMAQEIEWAATYNN